jgi:hypothetical protein
MRRIVVAVMGVLVLAALLFVSVALPGLLSARSARAATATPTVTPTATPTIPVSGLPGDVNGDCYVDLNDEAIISLRLGSATGGSAYFQQGDVRPPGGDGRIDMYDAQFVYGLDASTCAAPISPHTAAVQSPTTELVPSSLSLANGESGTFAVHVGDVQGLGAVDVNIVPNSGFPACERGPVVVRAGTSYEPPPYIAPGSGPAGTTFVATLHSVTPNSDVPFHLRKPDSSEQTQTVVSDGSGVASWTIGTNSFAIGLYQVWVFDNLYEIQFEVLDHGCVDYSTPSLIPAGTGRWGLLFPPSLPPWASEPPNATFLATSGRPVGCTELLIYTPLGYVQNYDPLLLTCVSGFGGTPGATGSGILESINVTTHGLSGVVSPSVVVRLANEYGMPIPPEPSVGGIAEQPDVTALPSAAAASSIHRDAAYVLGAAAALFVAAVATAGWRRRRRRV